MSPKSRYSILFKITGVFILVPLIFLGILEGEILSVPSAIIVALGINLLSPFIANYMVARFH